MPFFFPAKECRSRIPTEAFSLFWDPMVIGLGGREEGGKRVGDIMTPGEGGLGIMRDLMLCFGFCGVAPMELSNEGE